MLDDSVCPALSGTTVAHCAAPRPADDYLSTLNADQRRAVEYTGDARRPIPGPLLIIAGAGSGKTNTLAYRVAHLVRSGVDPQRILLLTFSRRAAMEMERRAGQILARVLELPASDRSSVFAWAGTFHSIGARLLRAYAPRIGLSDAFTVNDRSDSEDMLALLRHDLALAATRKPLPQQVDVPRHLFARGEQPGVIGRSLAHGVSVVRQLGGGTQGALQSLRRGKAVVSMCSITTTCCSIGRMPCRDSVLAQEMGERFDHILVDEYQDTNRLQASILVAMKPDGRGLTVVGDDAQSIYSFRAATVRNILDFPAPVSGTGKRRHAGAKLSLHAAHPRGLQRGHGHGQRALHQTTVERSRLVAQASARHRGGRSGPGAMRRRAHSRLLRVRRDAQVAGRAVPKLEPQCATRTRTRSTQHPVRQIRRAQVSRGGARERYVVRAALGGESAQPHGGISCRAAVAGHRSCHRNPVARRHGGTTRPDGCHAWLHASDPVPPTIGIRFCACSRCCTMPRPAGPPKSISSPAGTNRTCSASTTTQRFACATSRSFSRSRRRICRASGSSPN